MKTKIKLRGKHKKKHVGTHIGSQICVIFGYLMWLNPSSLLALSDNDYLAMLGIGTGLLISVLAIAKKCKWW